MKRVLNKYYLQKKLKEINKTNHAPTNCGSSDEISSRSADIVKK